MKLLEKMGWSAGKGLGAGGQGIVTPIGEGQKVRPQGMGLAFGGRSERSTGALEEARRRGEIVDEPSGKKKRGTPSSTREGTPSDQPKREAWRQQSKKPQKRKVEYRTYDQLIAEADDEQGVGLIVDLSGNAIPSQNLSSLPTTAAGSADTTRLPELRHNLTLLTSTFSSALSSLAREGKTVEERRGMLSKDEVRVRKAVESQDAQLVRLRAIRTHLERVKLLERETNELFSAAVMTPADLAKAALSPFENDFDALYGEYNDEYLGMRLDEAVVGTIAPFMRRLWQEWDPLADPSFTVAELKRWRRHFLIDKAQQKADAENRELDVFGSAAYTDGPSRLAASQSMSAYETMLWTMWLPHVRSAINNTWSPEEPASAIALFTSWLPLLPAFIRDNVLDQLILPKVSKAIAEWSPATYKRRGVALHTLVFPWLEHAGNRMQQLLDEAKRKVRAWLKSWRVEDGVPHGLGHWRDVRRPSLALDAHTLTLDHAQAFSSSDWDSLMLRYLLPQLGEYLRETFIINPRQQDLKPLENVLAWRHLLRSSMMGQLLEAGFFPKLLDTLYVWLTHEPNFEQVTEWCVRLSSL